MKIIEVRDGFIKFEADKSIYLSSFIQIDGMSKNYIAQVNQLKTFGEVSIASAKILFICEDNELKNYDKTEPSKDAQISTFTPEILNNSIKANKPVIIGKTLDNNVNIKIDASAFNKKMLVSVDDKKINNTLIRNLSKQFEHLGYKTIVLDTLGVINAKKYRAGVDFKLPLDTSSLAFMYESCLSDATSDSKSTIVEIFKDLSEYSKTVPFVPFGTLKTIVDDMVDKQHVFKLLVLKNKLAKFEKLGYFATSQKDVDNLQKIFEQNCVIIDFSGMDTLFQNRYLAYIYEKLNQTEKVQVFLETANTVSKKNLKNVISDSEIPTTLITHSKFQYLNDIKNMFDNFIIEPTFANSSVFQIYSSFLGSMSKDMYLVTGEALNYIPIVSETQIIDDFEEISVEHEDTAVEPESAEEELSDFEAIEDDIDEDNYENSDEDNNEDIIDISLDEDEPVNEYTHEEILAGIEEKSDSAIASIKENLETPKDIDIFEDTDEEIQDEELSESIETEAEETENVELVQEEGSDDSENLQEFDEDESDDTLSEFDNEEFTEENLVPDLAEINEESVSISEVSDEDMVVENIELNQEISHEELSEEMLEENLEPEDSTELIHEDDNSEQLEMDTEELDNGDEISLEEVPAEETVELDSDVEMLIENQDEPEEEYPQNTTLDVDFSEPKIMPLTGEALNHDFDEIVELDSSEAAEDDIIVDMSNDEQINVDEEVEQEIIEDVDKVYTTMKDDNELEEISDSDLDLIDALNNDGEELEEYNGEELQEVSDSDSGIIEEVHSEPDYKTNDADEILEHKESSTPIVPLYDADIPQEDMVMSDPIQQGDAVLHAKYGNGVVEKMIKYGNKTLYAINFENIGRRLLDPTLTEIKRV